MPIAKAVIFTNNDTIFKIIKIINNHVKSFIAQSLNVFISFAFLCLLSSAYLFNISLGFDKSAALSKSSSLDSSLFESFLSDSLSELFSSKSSDESRFESLLLFSSPAILVIIALIVELSQPKSSSP